MVTNNLDDRLEPRVLRDFEPIKLDPKLAQISAPHGENLAQYEEFGTALIRPIIQLMEQADIEDPRYALRFTPREIREVYDIARAGLHIHFDQDRKSDHTPYVRHPVEVARHNLRAQVEWYEQLKQIAPEVLERVILSEDNLRARTQFALQQVKLDLSHDMVEHLRKAQNLSLEDATNQAMQTIQEYGGKDDIFLRTALSYVSGTHEEEHPYQAIDAIQGLLQRSRLDRIIYRNRTERTLHAHLINLKVPDRGDNSIGNAGFTPDARLYSNEAKNAHTLLAQRTGIIEYPEPYFQMREQRIGPIALHLPARNVEQPTWFALSTINFRFLVDSAYNECVAVQETLRDEITRYSAQTERPRFIDRLRAYFSERVLRRMQETRDIDQILPNTLSQIDRAADEFYQRPDFLTRVLTDIPDTQRNPQVEAALSGRIDGTSFFTGWPARGTRYLANNGFTITPKTREEEIGALLGQYADALIAARFISSLGSTQTKLPVKEIPWRTYLKT